MRETTVRGLRTFVAAARHLSFKAAAEELCITPSAVSHQIKALEEQFGLLLFDRRSREIILTEDGRSLAAKVAPVLSKLDELVAGFVKGTKHRHRLNITLPPFFASEMFVPRLCEFTDKNLSVEIRVATSEAGASHPAGSDASVVLLATKPAGLVAHPLFRLHLVPACSPELARTLGGQGAEALLDATLLVHRSRPDAWRDWFAGSGLQLHELPHVMHLDSMFAVARAAEQGLGVALVPVPLIDNWLESGSLQRVAERQLATPDTYYFVYRAEDQSNPHIRDLRDWAVAAFTGVESLSPVE